MHNKLCNKKDDFFLIGHICIRDYNHQKSKKKYKPFDFFKCVCFMGRFSYSINLKGFHKSQGYFKIHI